MRLTAGVIANSGRVRTPIDIRVRIPVCLIGGDGPLDVIGRFGDTVSTVQIYVVCPVGATCGTLEQIDFTALAACGDIFIRRKRYNIDRGS